MHSTKKTKQGLEEYALSHDKEKIKPFMLVVCSDTDHVAWVENYVKSDEFKLGKYKNKVITVHSKKSGRKVSLIPDCCLAWNRRIILWKLSFM